MLVTERCGHDERFLAMLARHRKITDTEARNRERLQRCCDSRRIAQLARNRKTFHQMLPTFGITSHETAQLAGTKEPQPADR